ncbi:NUDIX hydrolase [Winogradskyella sediminis]|uniref:NUDIX hydrolase n=1 Tax=Winogradskyella sediminis TaxID=1382466 RepID=UPI000E23C490|nr:CoA pyrophosphatase [Winogradskyella sediminis]REG84637.1 8-oxo-dGTP pyrophosphatase MutT (NUDIX family) [Winogradskyella sediminis]
MLFNSFLESVVKIKHLELFGEDSHVKMSPPYRLDMAEQMKEKSRTARRAGVMALFYPKASQTMLVLILRKTYKGVHSAQVGFPGGKYEDSDDSDLMRTAIRETEEEIGVDPLDYKVLKTMSPLYIPPSNFMVHPFLGVSEKELTFVKQDEEVEKIIEVKLADFLNDSNTITATVPTSFNVDLEVPAFVLNGHVVWGATAMMLGEVKDLLKQVL